MRAREPGGVHGRRAPFGAARAVHHLPRGARRGGDHQAVPRRQNLVVEMRPGRVAARSNSTFRARRRMRITLSTSRPVRTDTSSMD
jgi:hypothetical protein